jgi:large subunit ribosomal protein L27
MAHKKAAGSAKNLRDSNPKYRGVKLFGGQKAVAGNIIIRQKGEKFVAGENTYIGRDATIHATIDGVVTFSKKNVLRFDGRKYLKTVVNIVPHGEEKKAVVATVAKELSPKPAKKAPAKKAPAKKTEAKAAPAKKAPAKKPAAKKTK